MRRADKIYIAGINGMVGSAIKRCLEKDGYLFVKGHSSKELDLTDQASVNKFFEDYRPEYVFLAAAKVGGIYANDTYPADFIFSNICIQTNIIKACLDYKVNKLLFLGSSCIYPKNSPQPIKEEYLLDGKLEPTNEAYAIAKIAGIKMCQAFNKQYGTNFISCMPTNLYGPNDNYDEMNSHVLPALIRKIHKAYISDADLTIWGTGAPLREFLYVDDLAEACVFLMNNYDNIETINVGSGMEVSIKGLADIISEVIGFSGNIFYMEDIPDGMFRKLLDSSRINDLGWKAKTSLVDGIKLAYKDYLTSNKV